MEMEAQGRECIETKIMNAWSKLSEEDAKLYGENPEAFYSKLNQKHGLTKEEAMKKIEEMEASCSTSADHED